MRELTLGELRCIDESANGWKMYIFQSIQRDLTAEEKKQMNSLANDYCKAFHEFYKSAVEKQDRVDSDDIHDKFDETYKISHPEFFDFPSLLMEKK